MFSRRWIVLQAAVILSCALSQSIKAAVSISERNSLIELYNSTNGEQWDRSDNWLTGDPCSDEWFGVTCDVANSTVIILDLNFNGLVGQIPPAIVDLENLEVLSLYANNLTGEFPSFISSMTSLTAINFFYTGLTGSIPSELENLVNLRYLVLSHNNLSGELPIQLAQLENLEYLQLEKNNLSGSIPPEYGDFSKLRLLWLFDNNLTGTLPPELGKILSLQQLLIMENNLTGSIPVQYGNLANLEEFRASDNELGGMLPTEFGSLVKLRLLTLGRNQFEGEIPASWGQLPQLNWLILFSNKISGPIPTELGQLDTLVELGLDYNSLYTNDQILNAFLDEKEGQDWSITQTIAPLNLMVSDTSDHAIEVSWDAIEYTNDSGFYEILYSLNSDGPYSSGGKTNSKSETSLVIDGLEPATKYYLVVRTQTEVHDFNENVVTSDVSEEIFIETSESNTIFHNGFETELQ